MDSRTYTYEGTSPEIHDDAAVAADATLVGSVSVGPDVTVWPGAVLRGDVAPVDLGAGSAIGDNAVLHGTTVEAGGMVGHAAVLNDAAVGEETVVGFNASVSESRIGERSIVAMGTVIPPGCEVPPDSFVRGTPAQFSPLAETDIDREAVYERFASGDYAHLTEGHEDLFA